MYSNMNATKCTCLGYICHGRRTIHLSTIFGTIFQASYVAPSYDVCVTCYILYGHVAITFGDRGSPYRDLAEIVWKRHSRRAVIV